MLNLGLQVYPIQDILFVCAVVFVWALGFAAGLQR